MAPATKRRSVRQAAGRKRSPYVDPETDDDFDAESTDGGADYAPEPAVRAPPQKKRKLAARPQRPQTRSKAAKASKPAQKRQTKIIGHARKPRTTAIEKAEAGQFTGPSDGKTPDWMSLPLAVLRDIFVFASQPLNSDNVSWLLKAARTCRAFAKPALEAYYLRPEMLTTLQPHHLLELMRIRDGRIMNYNTKVKSLEIKMRDLSYTAHHRELFRLSELVAELPRLQHLEVLNAMDVPPYRRLVLQQWFYPDDLLGTLERCGQRLKTWRWSRDMITEFAQLFPWMASVHEGKAFQDLEKVVICGFDEHDSPFTIIEKEDNEEEKLGMGWALSKLPAVKDLAFITCDIVREQFLETLPPTLERLELTNCWKLNGDMLKTYLEKKGSNLKELVLKHNVTLNLSFLTDLHASCPKLEVLEMKGNYYSERVVINDAEPEYDALLAANEVPTWPTTLRRLNFEGLQKWESDAAVNFFRSLVDAAPELPDLRYIHVEAHISIEWRKRAAFRDQWVERMQRVYLRRSKAPNPYNGSKKQFLLWKKVHNDRNGEPTPEDIDLALHTSRLSHVQLTPHKPSGDTDAYDSDDQPVRPTRRSTRVAQSQASLSQTPELESEEEASAEEEEAPLFIQGLCNVVNIRIDNQRPRETTFTERDFLDSEMSGDEDWNEGADIDFDNGYAW